ncbi:MAG TPA: multicopper oxidase [Candidatus Acidoferrales bacterium]
MTTRRDFLKMGALAGGGLLLPLKWNVPSAFAQTLGRSLQRFVDPLPMPPVMQPITGVAGGAAYYEVAMMQFKQKLHRHLAPTKVWGYNGSYPSATIEARTGEPVQVKWINSLPATHFLPVDNTLAGAETNASRAVVHLHGGHVRPENDGGPNDWFLPGNFKIFDYPNSQRATTLWFHDHALAITRLNVYAGLAGFYLIRDGEEDSLNLPSGAYEIPLVIQDRSFNNDGSLFYPNTGQGAPPPVPPIWVPEFFGDTSLVNGKVWPFLNVEPRKYRFRFLNGCNARFLNLKLLESTAGGIILDPAAFGPVFNQIGNEGGFLPELVALNEILLGSAERADVIIDFSGHEGKYFVLQNNAPSPFGGVFDPSADEAPLPEIMQFRVTLPLSGMDTSSLPSKLPDITDLPRQSAVRDLTLEELLDANDNPIMLMLDGKHFDEPISQMPKLNTTEIWRLINLTGDTHPIHLHLVQFQVLDRRPFDVDFFNLTKQIKFTGPPVRPAPNERGRKDTVRANPAEVTRIKALFDIAGKYVWHCHILEHEDNDMMRPYEVVP